MTGAQPRDDLGYPVPAVRPARRVVSLVPSLTEAVAATRPEALVGATIWCVRPAELDVTRVRGTKNPNLAAIVELRPDLVLANQEENRRVDVDRLRAARAAVAHQRRAGVARPRPGGGGHPCPGCHPYLAGPLDGGRIGYFRRRHRRAARPGQRLRGPPGPVPAR